MLGGERSLPEARLDLPVWTEVYEAGFEEERPVCMKSERTKPGWRVKLAERWRAARLGVRRGTVRCTSEGLLVTVFQRDGSELITEVKWCELNRVVAFKPDLITVDLVCMVLTTASGTVEIDEEMEGWDTLVDALPKQVPGTLELAEWWHRVAQPAFATNPIVLFSSH